MTLMPATQKTPNYGAFLYHCFFGSFKLKCLHSYILIAKYIKIQNKPEFFFVFVLFFVLLPKDVWEMDGKDFAKEIKMCEVFDIDACKTK